MEKQVVLEYIKAINEARIDKLYSLMALDFIFIDAHNNIVLGKDAMKQAWIGYFNMFPDYQIEIGEILEGNASFVVFGYAGGTYKNLKDEDNSNYYRVPAAWKVVVENDLIKHWQVYADNVRALEIINRNTPIIRELRSGEIPILEDMLYEAIYQPDEDNPIPKSVLKIPEVEAYIKDFGSHKDDYCLVAELDSKIIGAVWVRIISGDIKGYGYMDDSTPEFAISLFKEYRNRGIGTQLMSAMIKYLRNSGYKQTSLNVKKENYAIKLYKKMGFEVIAEDKEDYLMRLKLN
jgi:ribosomal protein S18 acetylase RimI-like enzyme/ketosteroid isomerase-like protein